MKSYLILHYGFEKPTAEDMAQWNQWFEAIAPHQLDRGGFRSGREIFPTATKDLSFAQGSITGYTIIQAENLDETEAIAKECPIVISTRVYEISK